MKINSTVTLFSVILLTSLVAGSAAGYVAYIFGAKSLAGVRTPEENPTQKLVKSDNSQTKQGFQILPEKNILVKVYDYVHTQKQANKAKKDNSSNSQSQQKSQSNTQSYNPSPSVIPVSTTSKINLPIKGEDQGIIFKVYEISQQQGSVFLSVNLQNNSQNSVKFLYSSLDVKDNKNNPITAIADGLPTELPANGQEFYGKITIPSSLLSNSQTISLVLSDYPDQKVQLKIPSIPIS
jgi:hypothetical protein